MRKEVRRMCSGFEKERDKVSGRYCEWMTKTEV